MAAMRILCLFIPTMAERPHDACSRLQYISNLMRLDIMMRLL